MLTSLILTMSCFCCSTRALFDGSEARLVVADNAQDFVQLAVDCVEAQFHCESEIAPKPSDFGAESLFGFGDAAVAVDQHRQRNDYGKRQRHHLPVGHHFSLS